MTTKIVFSGYGGQGVLTLGQMVANIAMNQGKHVTWMPSYGAEMRGGTANCAVIISEKLIGSPMVTENIDILVALNQASIFKFEKLIKPTGLLFANTSLILNPIIHQNTVKIDATNIASQLDNIRVANMVMLAGFLAKTDLFTIEEVETALAKQFEGKKAGLVELNMTAIRKGLESIE